MSAVEDARELAASIRLDHDRYQNVPQRELRAATYLLCLADAVDRLRRVEADHKNVLFAALNAEPNGVELVSRLTAYAISQRTEPNEVNT